jgi:hypothetical protein
MHASKEHVRGGDSIPTWNDSIGIAHRQYLDLIQVLRTDIHGIG